MLPFLLLGLFIALVLSRPLNPIALGDDLAASLGVRVVRTRVLGFVAVTLLAGGATALTGGIAFVGLMVPHVVRWFVGPDQRRIIAGSALAAAVLAPSLRRLELGDDAAVTQGTRPGPARLGPLVTGAATTALVTAAAGPIGFVALVAPQLARRLTRSPGAGPLSAAVMGAALLAGAHLLSLLLSQAFRPVPVGLITVCPGGLYLIRLLVREARKNV